MDIGPETLEMSGEESVENLEKRLIIRESDIGDPEVPLISWVDVERTSRGVHTGKVLSVGYFLDLQLLNVVPMLSIDCLSEKGDGSLSSQTIILRHVQIIDKEDHLLAGRLWTVALESLLVDVFLDDVLEVPAASTRRDRTTLVQYEKRPDEYYALKFGLD